MALTRITKGVIKPNENYDTHNINSTGIVTAIGLDVNGNGDISGNLSVGGVLTYEDVTSIDSVGIITAQKDIHVGAGISVVGVGSFGSLDISGDIDVDGHTNLDNVSVAGVTTITSSTYPLNVHADTAYQGILVNGNNAPTLGFNTGDNATPSWKIGLSGSNHTSLAISQGTGNTNRFTLNSGGGAHLSGTLVAEHLGIDGYLYHNSDTDTKLQFGTNTIDLQTGGSSRLKAENSGVVVTGILTATSLDVSTDLDVDGHTDLDNVSISGVTTITSAAPELHFTDTNADSDYSIVVNTGQFRIRDETNGQNRFAVNSDGHSDFYGRLDANSGLQVTQNATFNHDIDVDGHTNLDNVSVAGVTTFAQKINLSDNFIRNCRGFNSGNEQARIVVKAGDNSAGGGLRIVEYYNDDTTLFSTEIANFYTNGIELKENVSITGVTTISNKTQVNSLGIGIQPLDHHHIHIESANPRILIRSTGTNASKIFFGDNSSNDPGVIEYEHTNNRMRFGTNNTEDRLVIESDGTINVATTTKTSATYIKINANRSNADDTLGGITGVWNGNPVAGVNFKTGADTTNKDDGEIMMLTYASGTPYERLRITSDGDVAIGRDAALNNYAAGSTTTQLAVVKDGGAAGSGYHEVAHFTGGTDTNDTGAIVRITQFNNDRGLYIKGGRGTGDQAKAIFGLRNSANSDSDVMTFTQGGKVSIGDAATHTFSAHSEGDDLVVGGAGWRGLTIYGEGGGGVIQFADNADNRVGQILYNHGNDSMMFRTNGNVDRLKIHDSGRIQIGYEVGNTADIDTTNTRLTIKQTANNREDGIYIERSGERRGWLMFVGGSYGYNDAFCLSTNQNGTKTDVLSIDRGNVLAKIGGSVIIDSSNNGYGGLRIYDDSSGDYNVRYIAGRNQAATAHVFMDSGRSQNQSPWVDATPQESVRLTRGSGISFKGDNDSSLGQHTSDHLKIKTGDKDLAHFDNRRVLTAAKLNTKAHVFSSCTNRWASQRTVLKFYMDFYVGNSSATYHFMRMISQPDWSFDDVTIKQIRYQYSPDDNDHATTRFRTWYGSHYNQVINYNQKDGGSGTSASNWIIKRDNFGPGGAHKIHEAANGGYYRDAWGSDYTISLGNYQGVRLEITVYNTVGVYDTGTYATASDFYPAAYGGQATQSAADSWGGPRGVWFNTVANGTGSGSAPVLGIHQNNAKGWNTGSNFFDVSA